jgi:hypothetical protein
MSRQTELSEVDRDALERCIAVTRRTTDLDVDYFIKRDGWFGAALFCCYSAQFNNLKPRLWQKVPMDVDPAQIEAIIAKGDDGRGGKFQAARMLRKMLRAGLSRFEPQVLEKLAGRPPAAPESEPASA